MLHRSKVRKIAFVGDHLPSKWGIGMFMIDLLAAVQAAHPQKRVFRGVREVHQRRPRAPGSSSL